MQLKGKRALITGAGSGIGRAIAIEGAHRGLTLALAGRRPQALLETLGNLSGDGHFIVPTDVTKASSRDSMVAWLSKNWGALDILINNAGVVPGGSLANVTDKELEVALHTNLLAPISMVRDCLTLLRRSNGACVVNVGSLLGDIPYPLFATYSASKAGLSGFSIALRRELAPLGIKVVHASPRATLTDAAQPFHALAEPFDMKFDQPDHVAETIWNAIEIDATTVYPAGLERIFVLVQRLFPRLVDSSIAKQLARVKRAPSGQFSKPDGPHDLKQYQEKEELL